MLKKDLEKELSKLMDAHKELASRNDELMIHIEAESLKHNLRKEELLDINEQHVQILSIIDGYQVLLNENDGYISTMLEYIKEKIEEVM